MSIDLLQELIKKSKNIVFFGGAGTSTESNIPDFRSSGSGLYKIKKKYSYPPERIVSQIFFQTHTEDFFKFYREELVFEDAKPNDAHIALAKLEKMGKLKTIITQNVDGLHQKAGSENILEIHGSIYNNYCIDCKERYDLDYVIKSTSTIPRCKRCDGIVRPDVVLYGEAPDKRILRRARRTIRRADLLIVGGTSLVVYPATGLIKHFRGKDLVIINKDRTIYDSKASLVIRDRIGLVLGQAVGGIL